MQSEIISRFIDNWVEKVQQFRFVVIALVLVITAISIAYIKNHLGMSTDTTDMLSEELSWRKLDIEYERVFTETLDNVVIVIDSSTPDQASAVANSLYEALSNDPYLIEDIYYPAAMPYFRHAAFLFLEQDELYELADRLAAIQPFIGTLLEDKTLRGLFTMLEDALRAIDDGEEIDLKPLLTEINQTLANPDHQMSWQRLLDQSETDKESYREYIITKTREDPDEFLPGQHVMEHINNTIAKLGLEDSNTQIRLTGSTALSYEELRSVSEANIIAIVASFVLVTIILIFGLGSTWLFFSSITTLILGLIATTAFAAATVGTLNLISVAFAVLYIGLGIDFAIHLSLRYREACLHGENNHDALHLAARQMFRSLFLCALTTAIGFYSFMPTDYQGVAELGWIAGSGMFISLIYTFTLLPALLGLRAYKPLHNARPAHSHPFLQWLSELPYKHYKTVLLITACIVIVTLFRSSNIRFDSNILNLQDPELESVQTYRDLLADSDTSPWFSVILKKDRSSAQKARQELEQLDVAGNVVWLEDLVPENQDEKMFVIDELNLMMGPLVSDAMPADIDNEERLFSARQLLQTIEEVELTNSFPQLQKLEERLKNFINDHNQVQSLEDLEKRLLVHLEDRIDYLNDALAADHVETPDIPDEVKKRWLKQGYYKIEIYPEENLDSNAAMTRFVRGLQEYNDSVIGPPVVNVEAGAAVITAFQSALVYALMAITLLLLVLIKVKLDAVIILVSVLVGGIITFGAMLLFNLPFNFANIIGLPLLLGIGVDSGIHITSRFRHEQHTGKNIFMTSSSRGVIVSSLTTIFSIGNLAFSSHTGTASMGLLLAIGLVSMLVATMVILPSFLIWLQQYRSTT